MKTNARELSSAMQQLSTGNRINGAKDDAAGIAITQSMTAQIRGLNQAVRNANDGVNMMQTADGAMVEQTNMLQRMRELAVQAANGTYSDTQRTYMQGEFDALASQIDDIASNTTWNGKGLLDASDATGIHTTSGQFDFQVGASADETISVTIDSMSSSSLGVASLNIDSAASASATIDTIDTALDTINAQRADIGAGINRLTYAADNLSNISANVSASRSTVNDTDYAEASTKLSKAQIIQQASTAMLAQANQQPQTVLALLK
jgi:flagellin